MADEVTDRRKREETEPVYEAGDLLISYLEQLGVEYLFGIPGGAIEPLYNALARSERRGGMKAVVARHETGAAFMAGGYARNSGRLGVCCSTTGPGATNLITGVASAYESRVPLLVITAQTALDHFGRKALQESTDTGINIVGMFQFCTRYNTMVSHVDQLEQKLITAVMTAMRESAPVHLSIPLDILKAPIESASPSYDLLGLVRQPQLQDDLLVTRLCERVVAGEKIVFVLAGDSSEAASLILDVASTIGALLITTPDGKGLISPYHPLYRGIIGFAGHVSAEKVLVDPQIDTIIAVGSVVNGFTRSTWSGAEQIGARLIHIESEAANLTHTPMSSFHVRGSLRSIFETLSEYVRVNTSFSKHQLLKSDAKQCLQDKVVAQENIQHVQRFQLESLSKYYDDSLPIKPQWLMHKLAQLFPPNTRYLADTGNSFVWAVHYLHPFDRRMSERRNDERHNDGRRQSKGGLFQCIPDFAAMGWAIGCSIGTKLACPGEPVVCITGDGSLLMSGQEMTVALQYKLSVVFVVLNDSCLGMVKHGQKLGCAEEIGYELPEVNFAEMARTMGIVGYQISSPQDLLGLDINEICSRNGPTVLDVMIDRDEVPPMAARIKMLAGDK